MQGFYCHVTALRRKRDVARVMGTSTYVSQDENDDISLKAFTYTLPRDRSVVYPKDLLVALVSLFSKAYPRYLKDINSVRDAEIRAKGECRIA